MKKVSINHKTSLLIGLLSLNTLASCANTRKELGFNFKKPLIAYLFSSSSNTLQKRHTSALPPTAVTHPDHSSPMGIGAANLSSGLSNGMLGSIQGLGNNQLIQLDAYEKTHKSAKEKFSTSDESETSSGRSKRSSNRSLERLSDKKIDGLFREMAYAKTFNLNKLKKWLEKGLSIHVKNSHGANLIMVAIKRIDPEMLNFLIEEGVNVNAKLPNGMTPLSLAKKYLNHYKLLVSHNVKDYSGAPSWATANPFY